MLGGSIWKILQASKKNLPVPMELEQQGLTQFVTWTRRVNYISSKRAIESISQVSLTLMGHENSTKSSEPFKMDEAGS